VRVIEPLNLPKAPLRIERDSKGLLFVWCILRRKRLLLTPEEWVRQHLIHYLISTVGIPKERIISEYSINIDGLFRRCDIIVIDRSGKIKLIVECKSTRTNINDKVIFQIAHYNRNLRANYLMVSNGLHHRIINIDSTTNNISTIDELQAEWFI